MVDLEDNALATLAAAKNELQIPSGNTDDDDYIKRQINMASDAFVDSVGQDFHRKEDHVERVPGFGGHRLTVNDFIPINSIDSIELVDDADGSRTEVDATDYEIEDAERGWIRRDWGEWYHTATHDRDININPRSGTEQLIYEVTYTGGYITPKQDDDGLGDRTLPWDVEQAVIALVVARYKARSRDPRVVSESSLSSSVTYADTDDTLAPGIYQDTVRRYQSTGVS